MSTGSGVSDEGVHNTSGALFGRADFLSDAGLLILLICSVCRGAGASTGVMGDFVGWIGFSGGCSATIGFAEFPRGATSVFFSASGGPASCVNACFCVCMASGAGLQTTTPSVGSSFGLTDFSGGAITVFFSASGDPAFCVNACFCVCMASGVGFQTTTPSEGMSFAAGFSETVSEGGVFTAPEDSDGGGCGRGTNEAVAFRAVCPAGARIVFGAESFSGDWPRFKSKYRR